MSKANYKEKDSIMDFSYLLDKIVLIKMKGGREVEGILKGYDVVGNMILDEAVEFSSSNKDNTRTLGCLMARGPNIMSVFPKNSFVEISNPYEA